MPNDPVPAWRPIETAPKDGKVVLIFNETYGIALGFYVETLLPNVNRQRRPPFARWITTSSETWSELPPTHWMPLPPPPKMPNDPVQTGGN